MERYKAVGIPVQTFQSQCGHRDRIVDVDDLGTRYTLKIQVFDFSGPLTQIQNPIAMIGEICEY